MIGDGAYFKGSIEIDKSGEKESGSSAFSRSLPRRRVRVSGEDDLRLAFLSQFFPRNGALRQAGAPFNFILSLSSALFNKLTGQFSLSAKGTKWFSFALRAVGPHESDRRSVFAVRGILAHIVLREDRLRAECERDHSCP